EILLRQLSDGSWSEGRGDHVVSTALALLFLSKATATTIAPVRRLVGSGLLAGGRGLPTNLDQVQITDGQVKERKIKGSFDELLVELERTAVTNSSVEAIQAAVVDAVQLEQSEELFQQVPRLKKLASNPQLEVRRTACWALGRSGDVSAAPSLIKALKDPDESVVREASFGLCILSRRVKGIGVPIDPTEGLEEDSSDEVRKAHLDKWKSQSIRNWNDWYRKVRPYSERDDRTDLKTK
ncbi:hypothetical protein FJZ55_05655, partial [Candidatus Woesearchaeota archaeon]|nr:hypothetical protein [Candidatus Woesearchaeota archaeon]